MVVVYLHVIWFGRWIGFGVEGYPYGLLTMIVSLEAIFIGYSSAPGSPIPTAVGRFSWRLALAFRRAIR